MIPPEAEGQLLLLVQASDEEGTWSAGLVRARREYLRQAGNRDLKRMLNDAGRGAIEWLARWRAAAGECPAPAVRTGHRRRSSAARQASRR